MFRSPTSFAFQLRDDDHSVLRRVMNDVLEERAFFSLGEMTTITGWSTTEALEFARALENRPSTLSHEESRFLVHALYAWIVASKHGRTDAHSSTVSAAQDLDARLLEARRSKADQPS